VSRSFPGVPFVKATACGNDFLLIEGKHALEDAAALTRAICDRHNGVGADGVEWLYESTQPESADLRIRLINADGSPAELSGNGTRCVAAWMVQERGINSPRVLTDAGVKICELISKNDNAFEFRTAIGKPKLIGEISLELSGRSLKGLKIDIGNPQFIIFVDEFEDGWQSPATAASLHPHFPEGTNVEFVKVTSNNEIEIRIVERGAGETMSSGTGSSAAAFAAIATGKVQSPVRVVAVGGAQTVTWEDEELYLTGPARILCRGEFYL
jgi:diaminopimelate epimerase